MQLLVIKELGDQGRRLVIQKLNPRSIGTALPRDAICNSNDSNLSSWFRICVVWSARFQSRGEESKEHTSSL